MKFTIIFDNVVPLKNVCEASKQLFDHIIFIVLKEELTLYAINNNNKLMNLQLYFNINMWDNFELKDVEVIYFKVETKYIFDAIRNIKKDIPVKFTYRGKKHISLLNMKTNEMKKIDAEKLDYFEFRPIKIVNKAIVMKKRYFEDICKETKLSKSKVSIKIQDKSITFSTDPPQGCSYTTTYGKKTKNNLMHLEIANKDFFVLGKLFKSSQLLNIYPPNEDQEKKILTFSFSVDTMANGIFLISEEHEEHEELENDSEN